MMNTHTPKIDRRSQLYYCGLVLEGVTERRLPRPHGRGPVEAGSTDADERKPARLPRPHGRGPVEAGHIRYGTDAAGTPSAPARARPR